MTGKQLLEELLKLSDEQLQEEVVLENTKKDCYTNLRSVGVYTKPEYHYNPGEVVKPVFTINTDW